MPSGQFSQDQVKQVQSKLEGLRNRKIGATWKEANICLQQIMFDYTGQVRSETLLDAGLFAAERLTQKAHDTLTAANPHEMGRCLEVFNLLEIGKVIFVTAKERKETRGKHVRSDFPFTNPLLKKLLVVRQKQGSPSVEWRPISQ